MSEDADEYDESKRLCCEVLWKCTTLQAIIRHNSHTLTAQRPSLILMTKMHQSCFPFRGWKTQYESFISRTMIEEPKY